MVKCGYLCQENHFCNYKYGQTINTKIEIKKNILGHAIKTTNILNFSNWIKMPSKANPPYMKTIMTEIENQFYFIVNIEYKCNLQTKTIQFMCVDVSQLHPNDSKDSIKVIDLINQDKLPIMSITGKQITANVMSYIDGFSGSIWFSRFLYEIFDRVGVQDENETVFLSVINLNSIHTYWNGNYLNFGRDCKSQDKLTICPKLDIIGHELTHAIVDLAGGLIFQGESGALNESIADIFGECFKKYYELKRDFADVNFNLINSNLKTLSNPKAHYQPDTYHGTYWHNPLQQLDYGGVYTNSGLLNYLFYLICNGGDGTNDFGLKYDIKTTLPLFKAIILVYNSLTGKKNYQKIPNTCTIINYCKILEQNICNFQTDLGLTCGQINVIIDALNAIGIKDYTMETCCTPHDDETQETDTQSLHNINTVTNTVTNLNLSFLNNINANDTQIPFYQTQVVPDTTQNNDVYPTIIQNKPKFVYSEPTYKQIQQNISEPYNAIQETPRPSPLQIINLSNINLGNIKIAGYGVTSNGILLCYPGSVVSVFFQLSSSIKFTGLELQLEAKNEIQHVTIEILLLGSLRTQNVITRILPISPLMRKINISLPRTQNTKCVQLKIYCASYTYLKNLLLSYYY